MPFSELERLGTLRRFLQLKTTKEAELQRIVQLAAQLCNCPIGLITLLDDEKQVFLVRTGTSLEQTERSDAFCNQTILGDEVLVVQDAEKDARFQNNPLVMEAPHIRFYAGAPMISSDGSRLGSLCVINTSPADLTEEQQQMLSVLRDYAMMILDFEMSIEILKEQFAKAKNSEMKIRAFFESTDTSHLFLDATYQILHYNKAVSDFIWKNTGKRISTGENILDYMHQEHMVSFKSNFQQALEGKSIKFDILLSYPSGEIWWSMDYHPVYTSSGQIIGVSLNAADISSRKKHEMQVTAQNEALKEIARVQSHEVRRPVASILGLMNLMEVLPDDELREYLNLMSGQVEELDRMIHQVMATVNLSQQLDKGTTSSPDAA
ncbi:GAF domain-containing protein [Pedobacter sp. GR22-6]|uniref:GAF domain-containing protein n=1 Tax=Pedobacter sp. GR22-6 TaxID=3127957 RepID=UPI00307F6C97